MQKLSHTRAAISLYCNLEQGRHAGTWASAHQVSKGGSAIHADLAEPPVAFKDLLSLLPTALIVASRRLELTANELCRLAAPCAFGGLRGHSSWVGVPGSMIHRGATRLGRHLPDATALPAHERHAAGPCRVCHWVSKFHSVSAQTFTCIVHRGKFSCHKNHKRLRPWQQVATIYNRHSQQRSVLFT